MTAKLMKWCLQSWKPNARRGSARFSTLRASSNDSRNVFDRLSLSPRCGLGNIHWAADPQTDAFNLGDIIRVKFKGLLLTKDAASPYTVIDTVSIAKWGEQEWKIPDNRFISYELAEYWPRYFLSDYSQPKMNLIVTTDFLPTFSFLNAGEDAMGEVHIQDPLMLAGMGNFTATGYTQQFSYNLKKAEMTIQIRTSEDY